MADPKKPAKPLDEDDLARVVAEYGRAVREDYAGDDDIDDLVATPDAANLDDGPDE